MVSTLSVFAQITPFPPQSLSDVQLKGRQPLGVQCSPDLQSSSLPRPCSRQDSPSSRRPVSRQTKTPPSGLPKNSHWRSFPHPLSGPAAEHSEVMQRRTFPPPFLLTTWQN